MAHTTKLIVQQITQQTRRQPHPGQAKSSERKHANREAKRTELSKAAQKLGITATELVKRRATRTEEIRRAYSVPVVTQSAPKRSWMDDFHDDDRRWKY